MKRKPLKNSSYLRKRKPQVEKKEIYSGKMELSDPKIKKLTFFQKIYKL